MSYLFVFVILSLLFLKKKQQYFWVLPYMSIMGIILWVFVLNCSFSDNFNQFYPFFLDSWGMFFLLISVWVILLSIISGFSHLIFGYEMYLGLFLMMLLVLMLFFVSNNFFFFFLMFEISLIPIFLVISIWGSQPQRIQANYYFMLYTLFGGFPLFVMVFYNLGGFNNTFFLCKILHENLVLSSFFFTFVCLAFLCKLPIYSLHLWLPKAHVEAPVSGSMVLAGLLLKMSGYSLLRIVMIFKFSMSFFFFFFMVLSIWSALVSVMVCMRQADMKSFIAYSSVSHMSLCFGGALTISYFSMKGAYILFLAHGVVSPALFFLGNLVYERLGSRVYSSVGGVQNTTSVFGLGLLLFLLANMGFPPMVNFFGEMMMYFGLLNFSLVLVILLFFLMVLTSIIMLKFFTKLMRSRSEDSLNLILNNREMFNFIVILLVLIWMSLYMFFL